ncbi:MAG: SBBP repeat-containing protein [Flavobacteriales bacterium]|nr:SBBP repeat-containing protein [Flavobacteriales bacterium]
MQTNSKSKSNLAILKCGYLLIIAYFLNQNIYAQCNIQSNVTLQKVNQPIFIENKGQWHPDVLYLARLGGLDAWITKYGVNYTFYQVEKAPHASEKNGTLPKDKFDYEDLKKSILKGHRVLHELQDYNPNPTYEGLQKQQGYYNFLIGNNPAKHANYVGLYKEVIVKNIYDGIDIRYYFDRGFLRYDYVVHPGADPNQIKFKLIGQNSAYLKDDGNLAFTTRFGEVQIAELNTYQINKKISSRFVQKDDSWGITVGSYDKTKSLIIDPLVYSTYIGGNNRDVGKSIKMDAAGNAYVAGHTLSTNYDVTMGTFQNSNSGNYDVFVTKLNSDGTSLVFSTYIGGSDDDFGTSIALDANGNTYITGSTTSFDYPTSVNAYQSNNDGFSDVFITKLNASGTTLHYSTYLGSSLNDYANSIAIDNFGNAYITGYTEWNNFDITTGAYQTTFDGGPTDIFVTKINTDGTSLLYSTFLGGFSDDRGLSITVDASGNAYVTGYTSSNNFDVTSNAFQTIKSGLSDIFVTKLNANGSGLSYSTFLGGLNDESGYSIVVDASGNAYVTGFTISDDYDIVAGAFQSLNNGSFEAFVTKLNSNGTGLIFSTYLGGSALDRGHSIQLDGIGNIYITGETESTDFDVTIGAFQTSLAGYADVFVTKLNATGNELLYSSYIGGSTDIDLGNDLYVNSNGAVLITGETLSTNFPVTSSIYQGNSELGGDGFICKFDLSSFIGIENEPMQNITIQIYPNPNYGTFTIQSEKGGVFELLDINGRVIKTYIITNTLHTVEEHLPKGMYFVREKESKATQNFIIVE